MIRQGGHRIGHPGAENGPIGNLGAQLRHPENHRAACRLGIAEHLAELTHGGIVPVLEGRVNADDEGNFRFRQPLYPCQQLLGRHVSIHVLQHPILSPLGRQTAVFPQISGKLPHQRCPGQIGGHIRQGDIAQGIASGTEGHGIRQGLQTAAPIVSFQAVQSARQGDNGAVTVCAGKIKLEHAVVSGARNHLGLAKIRNQLASQNQQLRPAVQQPSCQDWVCLQVVTDHQLVVRQMGDGLPRLRQIQASAQGSGSIGNLPQIGQIPVIQGLTVKQQDVAAGERTFPRDCPRRCAQA